MIFVERKQLLSPPDRFLRGAGRAVLYFELANVCSMATPDAFIVFILDVAYGVTGIVL